MTRHLSYANVVSTLALVLAVGTGGAWAATQINGKVLKNNTVAGGKLKKNTLGAREVDEKKLKAVPRAVTADKLAGQAPEAFLPAGGTAANANQLGGIGPGGFVQGGGGQSSGRTTGSSGDNPNTVKSFTTPVGEFRLGCGPASVDVRYFNTTPGDADVFRTIVGPTTTDTLYGVEASGGAMGAGYSATAAQGPHFVDIRAGKGDAMAILRVGERRQGNTCIWNWELVTSG